MWKFLDSNHSQTIDICANVSPFNQSLLRCLINGWESFTIHKVEQLNPHESQQPAQASTSEPRVNTDFYMEKQEQAFCVVHAFNMAVGQHIFSGHDVISHIDKLKQTLKDRSLHDISLSSHHTRIPYEGNF